MLSVVLEYDGCEAVSATSIEEAVTLLRAEPFDLVLLDSFALQGDVFGPSRPVRDAAGSIPVVLFTGYRVRYDDALAVGFADVIRKLTDVDVLVGRLRALLSEPGQPTVQ
jgi:DNA-binding response OmpR family regulator